MSDLEKIKNIQVQHTDGSLTGPIPIAVDPEYIETPFSIAGENLKYAMQEYEKEFRQNLIIFDTVITLKQANNLRNGAAVKTLGYYAAGDGGDGVYRITSNPDLKIDEGSVIELKNGLKAWLVIKDSVNVKQFGAYGDGIHDDGSAIKNIFAINKECNIFIPNGTYIIGKNYKSINFKNRKIIGENKEKTILKCSDDYPVATTLFSFSDANYGFLSNITIHGNQLGNDIDGVHVLDILNSSNITIENSIIKNNKYAGIRCIGDCKNIEIKRNKFLQIDCGFISLGQSTTKMENIYIEDNYFDGHGNSEPISFFHNGYSKKIFILNNIIKNKTYGNAMVLGNGDNCEFNEGMICNNIIENCANGIRLTNGKNVKILSNTILNNGAGIQSFSGKNVIIKSNSLENIRGDGIQIKGVSENIEVIENNIVNYNTGDVAGPVVAIRIGGTTNDSIKKSLFKFNKIFRDSELYTAARYSYYGLGTIENSIIIDENKHPFMAVHPNVQLNNNKIIYGYLGDWGFETNTNIRLNNEIVMTGSYDITRGYNGEGYIMINTNGLNTEINKITKNDNRGLSFSKYTRCSNNFIKKVILIAGDSPVKLIQNSEITEDVIKWKTPNFEKTLQKGEIYSWQMICINNIWYEL